MDYNLKRLKKLSRVGIIGGTFDPIHFGHLAAAEEAREKYSLDLVLFIPAGAPPHKNTDSLAEARHRYNMVTAAIRGNKYFAVSRLEAERQGTSYSVDTVREIRSYMSDDSVLYFIIGADTAALVCTWKEYEAIEELARFIILPRPGHNSQDYISQNEHTLTMPLMDISSTDIRERVIEGKSISYLLPAAVERYIYTNGIYRLSATSIPAIVAHLEKTLTGKRYLHTMGVYQEAAKLSRFYGADEKKAAIAALLHDVAKDMPPGEKQKACERYNVRLTNALREQIDLTHPLIGCKIAAEKFGVRDVETLNAIKYHTTGRADMTLLEKVIYVADCIEPYREDYEGLTEIRAVAYTDIDTAMIAGLKATITHIKHKGQKVHPLSRAALRFLEEKTVK